MSLSISSALAIASCNLHVDAIDAGSGEAAGYFTIYSGPIPDEYSDSLVSGDNEALITMEMANPAFGAATDDAVNLMAKALAEEVENQLALLTGMASFYRQYDRDGNVLWQGTVTAPNLGGDMEISNTSVTAAVEVVVISYTFAVPYGTNS